MHKSAARGSFATFPEALTPTHRLPIVVAQGSTPLCSEVSSVICKESSETPAFCLRPKTYCSTNTTVRLKKRVPKPSSFRAENRTSWRSSSWRIDTTSPLWDVARARAYLRSEEHTSELQS